MSGDLKLEMFAYMLSRAGLDSLWMSHINQSEKSDLARVAAHHQISRATLADGIAAARSGLQKQRTERPDVSENVFDALDRGWRYATLMFGDNQIRSGHVRAAMRRSETLCSARVRVSPECPVRRDGRRFCVASASFERSEPAADERRARYG